MALAEGKRGNLPETGGHGTEHLVTRTVGVDAWAYFWKLDCVVLRWMRKASGRRSGAVRAL
jgi:hypothetical protein